MVDCPQIPRNMDEVLKNYNTFEMIFHDKR